MICPKCGKKLNSKYRYCLSCLSKSLGIEDAETENNLVNNKPKKFVNKNFRTDNHRGYVSKSVMLSNNKPKSNIDSSNVNGYLVGEGMSIKGSKLRKGSDTSRHALHRRWRYGY